MRIHAETDPDHESGLRDALVLIAAFFLLRLVVSWFFPATIDESYAIAVSRVWSLSYYDHPPVAFTLARLMAWLTGTENIFVVRLPFVLAGALSGWLVWDMTRLAYGARAAWWALAWYSVAPFFFISAGHFVVPDGPLNLTLLTTLRLVLPDLLDPDRRPHAGRWFAAGACFAIALASKYQAGLFGVSALAFLLASPRHRRLLFSPVLWMTLLVGALGLVPVLAWNAAHDWVSFGFQAGRARTGSAGFHLANFALTALGQMIYVLPGTWLVIMTMAAKGTIRPSNPADRIFAWFAILPPVVFLAIALVSRKSLPHWAMSGFLFGFPLAGYWTAALFDRYRRPILIAWRASCVAIPLLALAVGLQARHAVFTRPFHDASPRYDIDWQMQDWTALADAWPDLGAPSVAVTRNWTTGSKAAHALGPGVTIRPLSDPRHFGYMDDTGTTSVVAVHPARIGQTPGILKWFPEFLEEHGYRVTGDPRVLRQMSGHQLRFEIVVIPAEKAE